MWRQGDVFIQRATGLPAGATARNGTILVEGEATGHAHRLRDRASAAVYSAGTDLYVQVLASEAFVDHEEHGPIALPRGTYRVWRRREYTPTEIRTVRD